MEAGSGSDPLDALFSVLDVASSIAACPAGGAAAGGDGDTPLVHDEPAAAAAGAGAGADADAALASPAQAAAAGAPAPAAQRASSDPLSVQLIGGEALREKMAAAASQRASCSSGSPRVPGAPGAAQRGDAAALFSSVAAQLRQQVKARTSLAGSLRWVWARGARRPGCARECKAGRQAWRRVLG
jgi:hypothetical protein